MLYCPRKPMSYMKIEKSEICEWGTKVLEGESVPIEVNIKFVKRKELIECEIISNCRKAQRRP